MENISMSIEDEQDYRQLCEERAYWSCLNDVVDFCRRYGKDVVIDDLMCLLHANGVRTYEHFVDDET